MNAESKLEQAAFELAQALKIIIGDIKSKPNDTRYLSSLKVGANALLKYDEVRQSLTTPAGNEVEEILKKYKTFVSNIEWHIKTNEPKGDDLKQCELRLDCYNEIVTDLERTPYKPHQEQAADKCRCSDEIKTGQTSVMCCNVCGRPDECFWIAGQTQEPVGIDVEALAEDYLKKVGTHDRPDITKHDFINGFKAGYSASLPQSSTEERPSGEGDAVDGWTNKKPVFKAEGDFVTASWWKDHWEYKAWSMIKIEGEDDDGNEGYYLGLCDQDGNEWGDYDDLTADLYFILPKPPIK